MGGVSQIVSQEAASPAAARPRTFALVRRDLERYFALDGRGPGASFFEKLRLLLETPGLQAMLVYRFGSWVDRAIRFRPFRLPLSLVHRVLDKLMIICWGIHIEKGARIGGGFYIGHFGGVIIGPAVIGEDCNIGQQVVIGTRADGVSGTPSIGNRVWIGAGSVIFGRIRIGDGATIGPLTVVSRSLPEKVLVIGNPLRLVRENYDNSAEIYGVGARRGAEDL